MILEPNCFTRQCKHFIGVFQPTGHEDGGEFVECSAFPSSAFPKGIPSEIAYGINKHLVRHPDQENDIVYEIQK